MGKLITTLIIITVTFILIYIKRQRLQKQASKTENVTEQYIDIRNLALNTSIEQIKPGGTNSENTDVFGIVMDIHLGDGIISIVSFYSGDASMYTSSGGGVIGGGKHENISNAAKTFVLTARKFIQTARTTHNTPLPENGEVIFYILASNGKKVLTELLTVFENQTSPYQELFNAGNDVITQLRLLTEQSQ